jgi:hypothetical protein
VEATMKEEWRDEDVSPETTVVRPEPMMPPARPAVDLIGYRDVVDRGADTGRIAERYCIRPVRQRARSKQRRCCRDSRDDLAYHDVFSSCCGSASSRSVLRPWNSYWFAGPRYREVCDQQERHQIEISNQTKTLK